MAEDTHNINETLEPFQSLIESLRNQEESGKSLRKILFENLDWLKEE